MRNLTRGFRKMAMRQWKNNNRIVILNLEYTDLDSKCNQYKLAHEVLQFGAVMLNNRYEIIDKFNALVRPSFSIEAYNARKDKILNSNELCPFEIFNIFAF